MAKTTIINQFGKLQGWNNITLNLLGRDVVGITELSYSDTTKKENVMAAGAYPVGRSESNYEAKASITLLKEEIDAILASLPKGKRLQDIETFDMIAASDKLKDVCGNTLFRKRLGIAFNASAVSAESVRKDDQGHGTYAIGNKKFAVYFHTVFQEAAFLHRKGCRHARLRRRGFSDAPDANQQR